MLTKKDAYALTKEMLFSKFDGLCAFCGYELGERWHIWHIEPNRTIVSKSLIVIANDTYENKLPSCISCNTTRLNNCKNGTMEDFRKALYREFEFLRNQMTYATIYKKMIRYGLIEETGNPIVFHFEKEIK